MNSFLRICVLFLVAAFVFAGLDLLWLGMVMGDYYDAQLGPLKAQPVLKAPAVIFYAFYFPGLYQVRCFASRRCPRVFPAWQFNGFVCLWDLRVYELGCDSRLARRVGTGRYCVGVVLTGAVCGIAKICDQKLPTQ